ncbi:MAG: class I SAM-dependent methyltransferase [Pirellulaceae bacterium]
MESKALVGTSRVSDQDIVGLCKSLHGDKYSYLEHELITPVTYPYEWPISMLADAGICTLDLQIELAGHGYGLKDATAFNVQFHKGGPIFIDVSSIERPERLDLWYALGQFLRMFLFPLLLCRYRGWDNRSYFLGNLNGRSIDEVARSFSWHERLKPRMLLDLALPLWLHRWSSKRPLRQRELQSNPKRGVQAQLLNLRRLRRKIAGIAASYRPTSNWSAYTDVCNYSKNAERAKQSLVREFLISTRPATVLDLGCNTGEYSIIAADCGAQVISTDADHDAVETLYRRVRGQPSAILPLVVDLANPSPGVGYMNTERTPWLDRMPTDCVLCLALMHHLVVSSNLPLRSLRDLLARLAKRDLLLEFVPPEDEMFQKIMAFRRDLYGGLTLDACRQVFLERFELLKEVPISHTKRTLLFLRKRE